MEKFGSGIKDPGSATLIKTLNSVFLQEEMVKGLVGWLGHPLGPPIVVHCSAGTYTGPRGSPRDVVYLC
jgi:hypothetical protein